MMMLSKLKGPSSTFTLVIGALTFITIFHSPFSLFFTPPPSESPSSASTSTPSPRAGNEPSSLYSLPVEDAEDLYSTHNCVGMSFEANEAQEKTRCHFKNVCLNLLPKVYAPPSSEHISSVNLSYFRPPSTLTSESPLYWNSRFNLEQTPFVKIDRDSDVFPNFIYESIPKDALWSDAETGVLTESFWPENFGHALGDDYLPVYRLARSFSLWSPSTVQVIFHPSCHDRGDPIRGCQHHSEISKLLLDRTVEIRGSPFWPEDGTQVCFKNLLVGTRELGMAYPTEGVWGDFVEELRKGAGVERKVVEKQKVLVFVKKGRRTILNYEEVRDRLRERFEVEVELWDPSESTLEEQMEILGDTTVIVSPPGGVSFSAMFLPPGSSAVFVDYWDKRYEDSLQMERHIFTWQSNFTPYYYHLEAGDVEVDKSKVPNELIESKNHWLIWRDYADVRINLDRMESYVLSALIQASVSHSLPNSFKL